MFTFKKFAVLAVTGFFASSMLVACGDDTDDPVPVNPSYGFKEAATVKLGGVGNNDYGSSIDVDVSPFKVYKVGELTTSVISKIDLVYDGTNIYSPNGVTVPDNNLNDKYDGVNNGTLLFRASSAETADDLVDAFYAADDDNALTYGVIPSTVTKFGLLTSESNLALVKINNEDKTAQILEVLINWTDGD